MLFPGGKEKERKELIKFNTLKNFFPHKNVHSDFQVQE
jgi:hypothetical protein